VTDDRHDEIAARLREEGAARAPERLRADVMLQVRAEPRPRRIRPRRSYWRPLGSLAAAACLVAALVVGVNRMDTGSSGSGAGATEAAASPEGVTSHGTVVPGSAAARAIAPGPAAPGNATSTRTPAWQLQHARSVPEAAADNAAAGRSNDKLAYAPAPLRYTHARRLGLLAPLRQAFGPLEPRQGRGTHTS
jgi:negative regulator of sigma E activity